MPVMELHYLCYPQPMIILTGTHAEYSNPAAMIRLLSYLLLFTILSVSCIQESETPEQRNEQVEDKTESHLLPTNQNHTLPTGVPVPTKGRLVEPGSVAYPNTFLQKKSPEITQGYFNIPAEVEPKDMAVPVRLRVSVSEEVAVTPPDTVTAIGRTVPVNRSAPIPTTPHSIKESARFDIQCFGVDQGLPSSYIWHMMEDSKGYLWIATMEGVSRFDGSYFTHFGSEEGLLGSEVYNIIEDRRGNIWVATTSDGVSRFDGHNFTHFSKEEGLIGNEVMGLTEDSSGNIWIATLRGVSRYDPTAKAGKGAFTQFTTETGLNSNLVLSVMEDSQGTIWLGTDQGVIYHQPDNSDNRARFTKLSVDETFDNTHVMSIYEDSRGDLWFGTDDGAYRYSPLVEGGMGQIIHFVDQKNQMDKEITRICEDSRGFIWMGTSRGLRRYDPNGNDGRGGFADFTTREGLSGNEIISVLADSDGNIWSGGYDGICRYKINSFVHLNTAEGPDRNLISAIEEDHQGNLWIGTNRGVSRLEINPGKGPGVFTHLSVKEGLLQDHIVTILEDSRGNFWFGSLSRGVSIYTPDPSGSSGSFTEFTPKEGLLFVGINHIIEDRNGAIWIATGRGLTKYDPGHVGEWGTIAQYTKEEGLKNTYIRYMMEDSRGSIWLGTLTGVSRYDPGDTDEPGYFTHFTQKEGWFESEVFSITEDSRGNIWFATGNGIHRYDPSGDQKSLKLTHYTTKDGLSHHKTFLIHEDDHQRIWVSTQKGLSLGLPIGNDPDRASSKQVSGYDFVTFGKADGLKRWDFENNGVLDGQNRIWWGSATGLIMLDLDQFQLPTKTPEVILDRISMAQHFVDYQRLADSTYRHRFPFGEALMTSFDSVVRFHNYPAEMALPHDLNHLTFHFSGIDLTTPHKLKYSYQLEGLNELWSLPSSENKADYRDLSPGHYTFKVKAIGAAGIWSEIFEYSFRIHPPWWASWWAFLMYGLLFFYLLYHVYRFLLSRRLEQAEIVRLKELDAFKTRLYTNITHEFRTPLTIIMGMVRQVKDDPKKWLDDGLQMIGRNGRQLLNLVNQMLDLSKLDKGKLNLSPQPGEIVGFMGYLLQSFEPYTVGKNIQLHFLQKVDRLHMNFDPDQLTKVVSNLLSNAIKFTPKGGHVYVSLRNQEGGPVSDKLGVMEVLEISIEDTGPGIPSGELPRIFDRFYQIDDSSTRNVGGTGVGLALAKELVELMGGEIRVQSKPGSGTDFSVLLPVHRTAPGEAIRAGATFKMTTPDPSPRSTPETTTSRTIEPEQPHPAAKVENGPATLNPLVPTTDQPVVLLIEDNADVLTYLAACLEADYQLEFARNGQEGIEQALEIVPDIIISDIMMPMKDGYEVCATLKEDIRTSHIPIVLLTAKADQPSKIGGLKAGADAYLTKPFDKEELDIRLKKLLELRRQLQRHYNQGQPWENTGDRPLSKEELFLRDLRKAVEGHLADEDFGIVQLCREMGMSRSQFYSKIKALTGQSAALYLRAVRLEKAKQMLLQTDLNVSEVAFEVGFRTSGYFTQSFTEEMGMSPTAFRKDGR